MTLPRYQGWANYPTWAVALWIDNEQGMYTEALSLADDAIVSAPGYEYSSPEYELSERLKNWIEEMQPLTDQASMYSDLLTWATQMVDWHELATHYLEIAKENEE